jgi:hypothetical protein
LQQNYNIYLYLVARMQHYLEIFFYLALMDLQQGFEHFLNSDEFKQLAKTSGTYRSYKTRFYQGKLDAAKLTEILTLHGYTVKTDVKPPKRKISKN